MQRANSLRNKRGESMRMRSSTIESRRSPSRVGGKRHKAMIDCYEHEYQTQPLNMIECTVCEHAAYSTVEYVESEALLNGGLISRPCHRCRATTMWKQFELLPAASIA